jgi:hypothetical protein
MISELINPTTPIEEYTVSGKTIHVKREDLSTNGDMPRLAKLRGVLKHLSAISAQGIESVGVYDTRVSRAGQGTSIICKQLGLACFVYYPKTKHEIGEQHIIAERNGAILVPIKGNYMQVCFNMSKNHARDNGIYMMPWGLSLIETTNEVAIVAKQVPSELFTGSLVLSVGSATILSGILAGAETIPETHAISAGRSNDKQRENINIKLFGLVDTNKAGIINKNVHFYPHIMDYYEPCDVSIPFPCSPFYDAKAWLWMTKHIDELKEPILFWNIGQK